MSDPFVHFYPSDWLAGTRGLTAAETGIYITLISLMYEREAPLEADEKRLARQCGSSLAAFKKALNGLVAEGKIIRTEEGLWNERAQKEIEKRSEKRASAKQSANARWQKDKGKQREADANASQTQCELDANQKPEARSQKEDISPAGEIGAKPIVDISAAVSAYNDAAALRGWPAVQKITPARRSALSARLADIGGLDGWMLALERAGRSPLLCGENNRGWRASFDFLTNASNFTKLMEGNYDPTSRRSTANSGPDAGADQVSDAVRIRASLRAGGGSG